MNNESLSERLKRARKEKGLTLEELQKKTRVHINILKAIEGEALTNLSPVYLKGFIKIYCKALGLDYKGYVPDYKEPSPGIITRSRKSSDSFLKSAGIKLNSLKPNRKVRGFIVVLFSGLLLVIFLFRIAGCISSRKAEKAESNDRQEVKATASSQTLSSAIPKEAFGGIRLVISAKERCLIFVKVDGKVAFHRVLEKGRSNTWKAKERIELSLGNASAVEIIVNGQRFANLGNKRRGQPLNNIIITEKDGLKIPR